MINIDKKIFLKEVESLGDSMIEISFCSKLTIDQSFVCKAQQYQKKIHPFFPKESKAFANAKECEPNQKNFDVFEVHAKEADDPLQFEAGWICSGNSLPTFAQDPANDETDIRQTHDAAEGPRDVVVEDLVTDQRRGVEPPAQPRAGLHALQHAGARADPRQRRGAAPRDRQRRDPGLLPAQGLYQQRAL